NYGASIRNSYSVASTVITSLDRPSVSKSFKDGTLTNDDTSLAATTGANLTIGEQATFDILVTLPEGSTPDMVVSDVLPDGLRLDSYAVITLASGSGRLSQDFVGTLTNNPPSVSPALPVTGAGAASFSFGNSVATADGVAGNNAFVLRVTATVLNILGNQNGVTRTNSATVRFDDPAIADRTVTSTGGDPTITVVEPILALTKQQISVAPTPAQVGSVVTYRVTVAHGAGSAAPAYDVRITDALPAGLTLNLGSVSVTLNGSASGAVNNSAGNAIDVSVDAIPNDGSNVVIEYQATVNGNADVTVTNSADALWTTLPGASTDERGEGDGNPDGAELLGSGALNDYEVVGSSNLSVPLDMGDLPDSYGTTTANGGARHLPNGLTLGSSIDQETNGQPNASATGDGADENGVSPSSPSANWGGGTGAFLVTVNGGPGCLNAWMDFTNDSGSGVGASFADGNFTKTGGYDTYSSFSEHLVQNQLLTNGVTDVTFSVPTSLLGGGSTNYYFRFRLSPTDGNGQCTVPVGPTGLISGGEVEDYQVTFPPLAATLNSFSAEAQGDRIMVIWETVSELDNIGFNLYRSDSATGALNLLAFMPSQGPGSSQGFAYSYDDLDVQIGQTYWYWLEDISVSGVTTLHGPVSATLLQPTAVTLGEWQAGTSQPALLAALLAVAVGLAIVILRAHRVNRRERVFFNIERFDVELR
ncbi:MAG: isopeptide-forming domain-containing fimbrial protein, partial [Anaerolineae bacterium]